MDKTLYSKHKRNELHKVFDSMWTTYDERSEMYRRLAVKLGKKKEDCHFSKFHDDDWGKVERAILEMQNQNWLQEKIEAKKQRKINRILAQEEMRKAVQAVSKKNNRDLKLLRLKRIFNLWITNN